MNAMKNHKSSKWHMYTMPMVGGLIVPLLCVPAAAAATTAKKPSVGKNKHSGVLCSHEQTPFIIIGREVFPLSISYIKISSHLSSYISFAFDRPISLTYVIHIKLTPFLPTSIVKLL